MTYIFNEHQENWLKALETTNELQGTSRLHTIENNKDYFCCLGIACVTLKLPKEKINNEIHYLSRAMVGANNMYAPKTAVVLLKLRSSAGDLKNPVKMDEGICSSLAEMNDAGISFKEIADYIRQNPENVFLP